MENLSTISGTLDVPTKDYADNHPWNFNPGAVRFIGDLNTLMATGIYEINTTSTNKPTASWGQLLVMRETSTGNYATQMWQSQTQAGEIWFRGCFNNVWGPWTEVAPKDYVNAQDALKVAKIGDQMSGRLTVSRPTGGTFADPSILITRDLYPAIDLIRTDAPAGVSSQWRMYISGTGTGSGALGFAMKDVNGTATGTTIYFKDNGVISAGADPVSNLDVATKQYVDARVLDTGDTMTGSLAIDLPGAGGGSALPNLSLIRDVAPEIHFMKRQENIDASRWKIYISGQAYESPTGGNNASLSFASMIDTGLTNIATIRFRRDGRINATNPIDANDLTTKNYVDKQDGGALISSSGWNQLGGYANRVTYHGGMFTLEAMLVPTATKALTAGTLAQVCTLPANTWPVGARVTGVASYSMTTGAVDAGRLDVNTNGAVSFAPSASGSMTTSGWVGINITYREN